MPTVGVDVPVTAVFLVLFLLGAVVNMTIFQVNRRRGHKFLMSGMMFGFCMARITTCVLRIVWAKYPRNIRLAIAAQIFVALGVILLFVINLIFAQRITRASHPNSGWHPIFSRSFFVIYVLIVVSVPMLITATVQSSYTLNLNTKRIDRDIQLYGQTLFAIVAFLPIPLVIVNFLIPRKTRVEKFGSGRWRSKITVLLAASVLLCLGASFRVGTNYKTPRPLNDPAPYHNKACFYIFNVTVEILVVILYIAVRVDKRFHVPNGSKGPGDYSGRSKQANEDKQEGMIARRINTEDEAFGDTPEGSSEDSSQTLRDEEKGVQPADKRTDMPEAERRTVPGAEEAVANGRAV